MVSFSSFAVGWSTLSSSSSCSSCNCTTRAKDQLIRNYVVAGGGNKKTTNWLKHCHFPNPLCPRSIYFYSHPSTQAPPPPPRWSIRDREGRNGHADLIFYATWSFGVHLQVYNQPLKGGSRPLTFHRAKQILSSSDDLIWFFNASYL